MKHVIKTYLPRAIPQRNLKGKSQDRRIIYIFLTYLVPKIIKFGKVANSSAFYPCGYPSCGLAFLEHCITTLAGDLFPLSKHNLPSTKAKSPSGYHLLILTPCATPFSLVPALLTHLLSRIVSLFPASCRIVGLSRRVLELRQISANLNNIQLY